MISRVRMAVFVWVLGLLLAGAPAYAQEEAGVLVFARLGQGEPGGEGIYLINADGTDERLLFLFSDLGIPYDIDDGGYRCPVWSPDGSRIAFNGALNGASFIALVDIASGEMRRYAEVQNEPGLTHQVHFPEWVPGSNRISFGFTEAAEGVVQENGVRVVDLDSGTVTTIRSDITTTYPGGSSNYLGTPPNFIALAHSWSPDGAQVAIASYNDYVYLTDAAGESLRKLEASVGGGNDVDWSPDGETLLSSLHAIRALTPDDSDGRDFWSWEQDGMPDAKPYYESVAWSPSGDQAAFITYWTAIINSEFTVWNTISVVDAATGERREILRTPNFTQYEYPYSIACVDWQPAGAVALPAP